MEKRYLGDGVFVEVEDGMLKLTTARHCDKCGVARTETIYLGEAELSALNNYYADCIAAVVDQATARCGRSWKDQ